MTQLEWYDFSKKKTNKFKNKLKKIPSDTLALNVEMTELFIQAGLQDRVIQVYEGLVYMDFDKELFDKQGIRSATT